MSHYQEKGLLLKENRSAYQKKLTNTCYQDFLNKEWFKPSNHGGRIIFEIRKLSTEAM